MLEAHDKQVWLVCDVKQKIFSVELGDLFQGACSRTGTALLTKPPVLLWGQELLAPTLVGVLVKDPVTFHDPGKDDVTVVEVCAQI